MASFNKDFSTEALQKEDFWRVFGIDDETAANGNIEKVEDEEKAIVNRSKMEAMLMAEKMKADFIIEEENGKLNIIISKKI